jgi:hypothetical protein
MSTPLEEKQSSDHFEVRSDNDVQFDTEEVLDHHGITLRVVAVYLVRTSPLPMTHTKHAYILCRELFSFPSLV